MLTTISTPSCSPRCIFSPTFSFSSPSTLSLSLPPHLSSQQISSKNLRRLTPCLATKQQRQQKQKSSLSSSKMKKKSGKRKIPVEKPTVITNEDDDGMDDEEGNKATSCHPTPLPKPPAGFLLDPHGRVLMASSKRITTIVDATNNLLLECVIRRVFKSSRGQECMLLCPVDTPVQILKSTNFSGWSAVNDGEIEAIIPAAAYALAKIHMHLVISGFCYTARGGFCYSEEDILEFRTDDGEEIEGVPTEGVEITCFTLDRSHYMVYTPSDPLLFVAVKDENGLLQIADDDLLEDSAIVGAIDEETEFNALVEEEAALLESLLGER